MGTWKKVLPVRSAVLRQVTGGLVAGWATAGESPLPYVFFALLKAHVVREWAVCMVDKVLICVEDGCLVHENTTWGRRGCGHPKLDPPDALIALSLPVFRSIGSIFSLILTYTFFAWCNAMASWVLISEATDNPRAMAQHSIASLIPKVHVF